MVCSLRPFRKLLCDYESFDLSLRTDRDGRVLAHGIVNHEPHALRWCRLYRHRPFPPSKMRRRALGVCGTTRKSVFLPRHASRRMRTPLVLLLGTPNFVSFETFLPHPMTCMEEQIHCWAILPKSSVHGSCYHGQKCLSSIVASKLPVCLSRRLEVFFRAAMMAYLPKCDVTKSTVSVGSIATTLVFSFAPRNRRRFHRSRPLSGCAPSAVAARIKRRFSGKPSPGKDSAWSSLESKKVSAVL